MSNKAVPAVYRSIISSTVSQIRPDFDALGVEEAVLQELVRLWELKLAQSRAADFTGDDRLEGVARGFLPRDPNEKREDAEPEKSTSSRKPKKEGSDGEDGEGDDEDAINSDLDDDDDLDEQDDAEGAEAGGDLVIALYEKVQRVKNKWKVTLKDGLVSVNGKEYLFAKCQGYVASLLPCAHPLLVGRIESEPSAQLALSLAPLPSSRFWVAARTASLSGDRCRLTCGLEREVCYTRPARAEGGAFGAFLGSFLDR